MVEKPDVKALFADKKALQKIVDEQFRLMGIEYDPNATAEQARQLILADGVDPESNDFSRDIIAAREGG